jgi:hypothetical protein
VFDARIPKLKLRQTKYLSAVLVIVSVMGCVQVGENTVGYNRYDDCMFCHARTNKIGANVFEDIYVDSASHHPVNIEYPPTSALTKEFNAPNTRRGEIAFFDSNENGKPDNEDIRLFIGKNKMILTCLTCHREHNKSALVMERSDNDYLRGTNLDSELCMKCHRQQPIPMQHH